MTISLTVVGEAGHSSMPRDNAAPRVLSIALGRLGELEHVTIPSLRTRLETAQAAVRKAG